MRNKNAVLISALVCTACLGIGAVTVPNVSDSLTSVVQADDAVYEGFLYSVSGGEATVTGYSENLDLTNVVIPDVIKEGGREIPVTAIGDSAFAESKAVIITVGNNVKTIGNNAFASCTSLKELNLGKNTEAIGDNVLYSGYSEKMTITKLTVPDNLSVIGDDIYGEYGYTNVTELVVPASAEYIDSAFYTKASLKNITVDEKSTFFSSDKGVLYNKDKSTLIRCPQSTALKTYTVDSAVKTISGYAFYSCSNLQIITVNEAAESIGDYAFAECSGLTELTLGKNVTSIGECALTSSYAKSTTLSKLTLPDNLYIIGDSIYGEYGYTNVTELVVPASAEYIDGVFYNKGSLKNITVDEKNTLFSSDKGILYSKDKSTLIRCPQSTALKTYTVDSAVKTIESNAFNSCTNLQVITVNDTAESIGEYAFAYCSGLTELTLGKNVSSLGECAVTSNYGSNMKLSKLTIPDNLSVIGDNIYGEYGYTEVTELIVPASAEYIAGVFYKKGTLKNITVDENNAAYSSDKGVLYSKDKSTLIRCPQSTALKTYTVDSAVKTIESNAFNSCKNLQVITVNDTAESIGDYAFAYCQGLSELVLGKNVTSIGEGALASNYGSNMKLSKLTVPDNLSVIGDKIYGQYGYTEVTELIIPASAEYINNVFYTKSSLKNITVEENNKKYFSFGGALYSLESSALLKFPQSSDVLIYNIVTGTKSIAANAFTGTKLQSVLIPSTVKEIGENAFKGSALKTVRGTKGSYAETFAAENSYAFEEAADPDVKLPAASAVPSPVPTASASPTASPSPSASSSPSPVPTASPSPTPSAKPEGGNGDVDGDGKSTTTDVRKILQYLVGTVKFTDAQKTTADINGDKAVNSTDALLLLRKVAGVVSAE